MKLRTEPFLRVLNGGKTIESRLYDEKRREIRVGDEIEFQEHKNESRTIRVRVTDIYLHNSFQDLFSQFPPSDFGGETTEDLLIEIYSFYSKEEEKKFGVIGMRVELFA